MQDTLTMSTAERKEAHILRLLTTGGLSLPDASPHLGITGRHCYRVKAAYLRDGDAAVVQGLRGRPSNFDYRADARREVLDLARRLYTAFGPTLLSEMLEERHDLIIDSETLRRGMLKAGRWAPARNEWQVRR